MNFSILKMLKKAMKVGCTATAGASTVLGVSGIHPVNGLWAGLVSALFTCAANFFAEAYKHRNDDA